MSRVFVYGTLLEDSIARKLLGRLPRHKPARLQGYARYRVKDASFPAIIPEASATVDGRVRLGDWAAQQFKRVHTECCAASALSRFLHESTACHPRTGCFGGYELPAAGVLRPLRQRDKDL